MLAAAFARLDPTALGTAMATVSAVALWLATAVLLVRGGPVVGPHLSRLAYYLPGYSVSWPGAFVGLVEGALAGFGAGVLVALLWNAYHRLFVALAVSRELRRVFHDL